MLTYKRFENNSNRNSISAFAIHSLKLWKISLNGQIIIHHRKFWQRHLYLKKRKKRKRKITECILSIASSNVEFDMKRIVIENRWNWIFSKGVTILKWYLISFLVIKIVTGRKVNQLCKKEKKKGDFFLFPIWVILFKIIFSNRIIIFCYFSLKFVTIKIKYISSVTTVIKIIK